jgi:NAD(P)-dependent dehydrogenase (short-subunit alcohol dehydrogenase family)
MDAPGRLLIFGVTGAIGSALAEHALRLGWHVTGVSRSSPDTPLNGVEHIAYDPLSESFADSALSTAVPFHAVCWAQGANANDSVYDVDLDAHMQMYRANCLYVVATLNGLLQTRRLMPASRLCVISSIWQNLARQSKLSYCMTKAALEGLVLSASADMAKDGHLVNAVLPGALETPMTRKNLSVDQLERLTAATQFGRLASLSDVSSAVLHLCSPENTGITGQFIAVDLGFSRVRIV